MALEDAKTRIEVFGAPAQAAPGSNRIDESVLRLARLIGRQMAREEFDRQRAKATRGRLPGRMMREQSE